jgi:dsDNA-specific endonuclease/ATPase MutS2
VSNSDGHSTADDPPIKEPIMADTSIDNLTKVLKDVLYVGVGAGVIAFQKAQVQRRELRAQLTSQFGEARTQFETVASKVEDRVKLVEERIDAAEARLDTLLDQVEENLPEQAREPFKQARKVAKDTRTQVRSLVNRAA